MKALNKKERRISQWMVALFFIPVIGVVTLGMTVHFKVMAMQVGDLDEKELLYDEVFKAQAQKGEVADELIRGLRELRDSSKSFVEHQVAQKAIHAKLAEMLSIQPLIPDTNTAKIRSFPAIYDSLAADIRLMQSTRDSIKTCDEQIKNQRFQLEQCLDALSERLAEKRKGKQ